MTVHYVSSLHCFLLRCYLLLTFIFHLNLCLGVHASVFPYIHSNYPFQHLSSWVILPVGQKRERQVSVVYFRAGYGPEDYPTEARRCPILLLGNRCSNTWTVGFLVNMLDTLYGVFLSWSMTKVMVPETNATTENRTIFIQGAMASETHVCHSLESQL